MSNTTRVESIIDKILVGTVPDMISQGITVVDVSLPDQPLIYVNRIFENMTGYKEHELIGSNCRLLQNNDRFQPDITHIKRSIKSRQSCIAIIRNYTKDGTMFWNRLKLVPYFHEDNEQCDYYIGLQEDISEQMSQHEKIQYLYTHDLNTKLLNYMGYYNHTRDRIEQAILSNNLLCMGLIQVHFIQFNDLLKHEFEINRIMANFAKLFKKKFYQHAILAKFEGLQFAITMVVDKNCEEWIIKMLIKLEDEMNLSLSDFYKFRISYLFKTHVPDDHSQVDQLILDIMNKVSSSY